jgi:hypothetical protein
MFDNLWSLFFMFAYSVQLAWAFWVCLSIDFDSTDFLAELCACLAAFLLTCVPLIGLGIIDGINKSNVRGIHTHHKMRSGEHLSLEEVQKIDRNVKFARLETLTYFLPVAMLGLLWLI